MIRIIVDYAVPKPKSLYLGSRVSDENRKKIIEIARARNIDVHIIKLSHNKLTMVPEKIDIDSSHSNSIQPTANAAAD